MNRRISLLVLIKLMAAAASFAASDANAEQTRETELCGTTIERASASFHKKVYKRVGSCLLKARNCAEDQNCLGKLLVLEKGACAAGKLDSGYEYFGGGSAITSSVLVTDPMFDEARYSSALVTAHYKFVEKLGRTCFADGVDLSDGADGLGFNPVPGDKFELADALNPLSPAGVACSAHHDLLIEIPDRDALASSLKDHPANVEFASGAYTLAVGVGYIAADTLCK